MTVDFFVDERRRDEVAGAEFDGLGPDDDPQAIPLFPAGWWGIAGNPRRFRHDPVLLSLVLLERDRRAPRNPDAPFGLLCSPGLRREEGVWFAGRRVSTLSVRLT